MTPGLGWIHADMKIQWDFKSNHSLMFVGRQQLGYLTTAYILVTANICLPLRIHYNLLCCGLLQNLLHTYTPLFTMHYVIYLFNCTVVQNQIAGLIQSTVLKSAV